MLGLVHPSPPPALSANALRREVHARNLLRAEQGHEHEQTIGATPGILYIPDGAEEHGNFHPAAYRRIVRDPAWSARLQKAYTSSARVPRRFDRRRAELDCAASSDALLMNLFCYPGLTRRRQVCGLLGIDPGLRPEFGFRARLPMQREEIDRTEIDMRLGGLMVEAKLTEGGFGETTHERLGRYRDVEEVLDLGRLPASRRGVRGWQLIRGVLAAHHHQARFLVLCDHRRTDLREQWFQFLGAVRSSSLRCRLGFLTWQELAAAAPPLLVRFLAEKYGILVR
jgi:hypothetical protein